MSRLPRSLSTANRFRPNLTVLESRDVPATINVTSLGDTVAVDGAVTLREAIRSINGAANINADVNAMGYGTNDTITFTGLSGTIALTSNLDALAMPVVIDGNTGMGFTAAPVITVDGNNNGTFVITASNVTIRGLSIVDSDDAGILITGATATGALITGNYIGVRADGVTAEANRGAGVLIEGGAATNTIGGATAAARNVISGNTSSGVLIQDTGTTGNTVQGNLIGTNAAGTAALANGSNGVTIAGGATGNTIGGMAGAGNVIAFNTAAGITVTDPASTGNGFLGNSIFSNGALGIDLGGDGVTANDSGDPDPGPNRLQNYPVITSVVNSVVSGTFNSTPNTTFRVELFTNAAADSAGFGQGQTFLMAFNVTTDGSGNATFSVTIPGGTVITATATDLTTNETSEFSNAVTNIPAPPNVPPSLGPPAPPSVSLTYLGNIPVALVVDSSGVLTGYTPIGVFQLATGVRAARLTFTPQGSGVLLIVGLEGTLSRYDATSAMVLARNVFNASATYTPSGGEVITAVLTDGSAVQVGAAGTLSLGGGWRDMDVAFQPNGAPVYVGIALDGTLQTLVGGPFVPVASGFASADFDLNVFGPTLTYIDSAGGLFLVDRLFGTAKLLQVS